MNYEEIAITISLSNSITGALYMVNEIGVVSPGNPATVAPHQS